MAIPQENDALTILNEALAHQVRSASCSCFPETVTDTDGEMTITEKQRLAAIASPADQILALSTLWTIKECYTKAIGEGIVFGMERIAITLSDDKPEPESIRVDGTDLGEMGRKVQTGWLEDKQYRWAVISLGEGAETIQNDATLELIEWDDFVKVFDTMHS
jgi:4'-phosphopantetheinyl transferase